MPYNRLSTEYLKLPVAATDVDGTSADPTGDVVAVALTTAGARPVSGDYKTGSWESGGGIHYARVLVGPVSGDFDFSTGTGTVTKWAWVKVTDNPEVPVLGPIPVIYT